MTENRFDQAAHAQLVMERHRALTVPCTYCRAPQGDPCTNPKTGAELGRLPAHTVRLQDAGA